LASISEESRSKGQVGTVIAGIYVVNADGSNEIRLTFNSGVDASPNWSPDGRIFFTSNRDGRGEIYVMNADGGAVSRFTTTGAKSPAVSPDGSKVALIGLSLPYQSPVYVADPDGGNVRMIKDQISAFWPCWSADGASIAVAVDKLGVSNIFQIDLNGGNLKRLTAGPKMDTQPAISPDGSKLAFESNRNGNYEIYVMNLR
jgi:Tol biopolymer transport system component